MRLFWAAQNSYSLSKNKCSHFVRIVRTGSYDFIQIEALCRTESVESLRSIVFCHFRIIAIMQPSPIVDIISFTPMKTPNGCYVLDQREKIKKANFPLADFESSLLWYLTFSSVLLRSFIKLVLRQLFNIDIKFGFIYIPHTCSNALMLLPSKWIFRRFQSDEVERQEDSSNDILFWLNGFGE